MIACLAHLLGGDAGAEAEPARVERLEADERVDVEPGDPRRASVVGDLLDVDRRPRS